MTGSGNRDERCAEPAFGLIGEAVFVVTDAHRAECGFGKIVDFVALGLTLARDEIELVVAVEMDLVGIAVELLAGQQLLDDIRIAGSRDEGREPVESGHDIVLDFTRGDLARPAQETGHTEAAFERCTLAARERRLAAIRPSEILRAVIGRKHHDGVLIKPFILQILQDPADHVVELRHAGFLDRPAILGVAQILILVGQVGDDVHARRVHPYEERLAVRLGLADESFGLVEDDGVDRLHVVFDAVDRMRR